MEKYLAFFLNFEILFFRFLFRQFRHHQWMVIWRINFQKNSQVFFHCNSSKIISFDFCVHNIIMASYEKQLLIILDNNVKPMNQMWKFFM